MEIMNCKFEELLQMLKESKKSMDIEDLGSKAEQHKDACMHPFLDGN
jgi:hypothetical protein